MNINSSSRTIIINGLKPNFLCPASSESITICEMNTNTNSAETQKKGRKRTLEHLSFEEKILRKLVEEILLIFIVWDSNYEMIKRNLFSGN